MPKIPPRKPAKPAPAAPARKPAPAPAKRPSPAPAPATALATHAPQGKPGIDIAALLAAGVTPEQIAIMLGGKPAPVVTSPAPSPARSPGRPAVPPAKPAPAPSAPPAPSAETVALKAELTAVRAELAKLSKAAAKTKGPAVRTEEEILTGAPELAADDWRAGYAGTRRYLLAWERPDNGWGKPHAPIALTGAPSILALLAIPRDSDGPHGAACRAAGLLAVYETTTEDGRWMPPVYVNEAELGVIWDHEANEGIEE